MHSVSELLFTFTNKTKITFNRSLQLSVVSVHINNDNTSSKYTDRINEHPVGDQSIYWCGKNSRSCSVETDAAVCGRSIMKC